MSLFRKRKDSGKCIVAALAAGLLVIGLFALYAFLPLNAPARDASPDENANRYFSQLYAERGELAVVEPLNFLVSGAVHPRSVAVREDGYLVPGGFLGLPVLYGSIGAVLGSGVLPYLTAVFALLGLLGFWLALSGLFSRRFSWLAVLLLAFNPVWWYWASRPFMPNVLFLSLVLLSAGCLWGRPLSRLRRFLGKRPGCWLDAEPETICAGVFLGLALAVRPPEAYWLLIIALVAAFSVDWRLAWRRAALFAIGFLLAIVPFLHLNNSVYGSPWASGYAVKPTEVSSSLSAGGLGAKLLGPAQPYLFPLGFAPRTAVRHFFDFGLQLYAGWWLLVLMAGAWAAAGVFSGRKHGRQSTKAQLRRVWKKAGPAGRGAALSAALASLWLIAFYGSWTVHDNPDAAAVTVGASYLRYWLPIFVFTTLPVAWLLDRRAKRLGRPAFLPSAMAVIIMISGWSVFTASQEGLLAVGQHLNESQWRLEQVLIRTAPGDLVIVDRSDKFVFPHRPVMYPLRSDRTWSALQRLLPAQKQVYYLGITLPSSDLEWLNAIKLPPISAQIRLVQGMGEISLYVFEYRPGGGLAAVAGASP